MQPLRIWFNRTFATTYWLVKLLRENPDARPVIIHATHVDQDSPVLAAADVRGIEHEGTGTDYLAWALAYCKDHHIDIFFPRNNSDLIAAHRLAFEAIGTHVLTSPSATVNLFGNKRLTYMAIHEQGLPVPPWASATSSEGVMIAYERLRAETGSGEMVIKPTVGFGAHGFRIITDRAYTMDNLLASSDRYVNIDNVVAAFRHAEANGQPVEEVMLLPFLDGPEVSVDTLADPRDNELLAAIPRTKISARKTLLTASTTDVMSQVRELHGVYPMAYLSNVQFRWYNGEPVLLEVNTRPSGGLHAVSMTGLNLPWAAIKLALGEDPGELVPVLGGAYTSIDLPVSLPG